VNGGSATIFNNDIVSFDNSSTAGDVTIVNVLPASLIVFRDGATGGNATITSAPALSSVLFLDCSRAGNATINFLGGSLEFRGFSSAESACVSFHRDIANSTMDLNDVEKINFNALGGGDNVVVNDRSRHRELHWCVLDDPLAQSCSYIRAKITDVHIARLLPRRESRTSLHRSHRSRKQNQPGLRRLRSERYQYR
jgi:hypothetical protein